MDRGFQSFARLLWAIALALTAGSQTRADVDTGTIRLRPAPPATDSTSVAPSDAPLGESRRGFDFGSFESRLQNMWFQRKIYLSQGREGDAARQSELIRAFCNEEGIGRLQGLADALLIESQRHLDAGQNSQAFAALDLAEHLDPGRAQIRFARARAYWASGQGILTAATELVAAVKASVIQGVKGFTLVNQLGLLVVVAAMGSLVLFAVLMLVRYQVALRHEIEEWCLRSDRTGWGRTAGWIVLLLPLLLWIGAGWVALFWVMVFFRFMRRGERLAAAFLLACTMLAVPAYRVAVAVYGLTTDPAVRTTLEAASGPYSPDRIVKLRKLVVAHPEDPTYRFLLAGLYKSGRYFEEAFDEYKRALETEPSLYQAYINIGNIFHETGQYGEAIANYRRALDIRGNAVLAYYNMHMAQAESFRFKESKDSLAHARDIDPERIESLMTREGKEGNRAVVVDAVVDLGSIWQAAFDGGGLQQRMTSEVERADLASLPGQFLNPISIAAVLALIGGLFLASIERSRQPARRCIRCGRPFCQYCKSGREGHEYCSQCLHLFVLGDGLAPETKNLKLYEVERFEKLSRLSRRLVSLVLPGSAQVLRGRVLAGVVLLMIWIGAVLAWQPGMVRPLERFLGLDLRLDLLRASEVPPAFHLDPWSFLGLVTVVLVWLAANVGTLRRKEA